MGISDGDDDDLKVEEVEVKATMEDILSNLGSSIGALYKSKKETCYDTICSMKEDAEDEKSAMQFTQMLRPICQQER